MEPNELAAYLEQFSGEPEPEPETVTASAPVVATVGYKGAMRGRFAEGTNRRGELAPHNTAWLIAAPVDEPEDTQDEP